MKKRFVLASILISILLASTIAYAAGSSGGGSRSTQRTQTATAPTIVDCESKENMRDRVHCRLVNQVEGKGIHESCKAASDVNACARFYEDAGVCYNQIGISKDNCFKRKAKNSNRQYVVLLLYDLEERVEDAYNLGNIKDDAAADLVNKIIEIKKAIISGQSRETIKSMMKELKDNWRKEIK